ncbi:MAG: hypothetical protein WA996_16290 [Candidatus Promineifilaceae bacterium]
MGCSKNPLNGTVGRMNGACNWLDGTSFDVAVCWGNAALTPLWSRVPSMSLPKVPGEPLLIAQ